MTKKQSFWTLLVISLAVIVYGAFCLVQWYNPKDFNTLEKDDIRAGMYVEGEVRQTLGYYCAEDTYRNFAHTSTAYYYLIPFGENGDCFIGFKTTSKTGELDSLTDATIQYLTDEGEEPEGIGTVKGRVYKCDSEELGYLKDFLQGTSIPYVEYFILETDLFNACLPLGVGVMLFILAVAAGIACKKDEKKQEKLQVESEDEEHEVFL